MLARCRKKADERGITIDLRQSDFRELTRHFDRKFDCVMSTGNSLAYVTNDEITGVLEQMDALVQSGGYLYFDLRNWDKIVRQKMRFYCYNPTFLPNGDRVNLMQVWDHLSDGSIVFNLVYTFERGVNILNLRRAGGVWELETVSAPFIKHSHKINLIHPQVSGEVEVSKVVSKTNDSGFIRTYIYF